MAKTKYNKQYFIDKFSALNESEIGKHSIYNHCALFHLGVTESIDGDYIHTEESKAMTKLLGLKTPNDIFYLSDGTCDYHKLGDTPKQRILNALAKA